MVSRMRLNDELDRHWRQQHDRNDHHQDHATVRRVTDLAHQEHHDAGHIGALRWCRDPRCMRSVDALRL